jgi:lysyl-tRNA synthetase class 2
VVLELYEQLVEARTEKPTFYIDFPQSVSPLTRPHRSKPGIAERWDLVAWGVELGTAYSELTDPVEQRRRLEEQSFLAAGGDPEAMELDEDFLQAMEYAMPPTGGLGMGEHPRHTALPAGEAAVTGPTLRSRRATLGIR